MWRSEARMVVPWWHHRRVQGRSQSTTLSAPDLHNAQATILISFYNMDHEIIKKIKQNKTWIEAGIPWINLNPVGIMHSPQPLSMSAMMSQSQSTPWRHKLK